MTLTQQQIEPTCISASGSVLRTFSSDDVLDRWATIRTFIDRVPDYDEWNNHMIMTLLRQGKAQCWMSYKDGMAEAMVITQIKLQSRSGGTFQTTRDHFYCLLWVAAGDDYKNWIEFLAEIEKWAATKRCKYMVIKGRRGWSRILPEYKETYTVMKKRLTK